MLTAVLAGVYFLMPKSTEKKVETPEQADEVKSEVVEKEEPKPKEEPVVIKEEANLEAPFTVQAPFANWKLHRESCEEAAALMYDYFLKGQKITEDKAAIKAVDKELRKMKDWQVKNYGSEPDLSIADFAKFVKSYFGYNSKVIKEVTKDDIKREISKGNPVIIPATTASLKNPFYPEGSNVYHYLLIKGYKPEGVITNDPGTKRGESYFYSWDTIFKTLEAQKKFVKQGNTAIVIF